MTDIERKNKIKAKYGDGAKVIETILNKIWNGKNKDKPCNKFMYKYNNRNAYTNGHLLLLTNYDLEYPLTSDDIGTKNLSASLDLIIPKFQNGEQVELDVDDIKQAISNKVASYSVKGDTMQSLFDPKYLYLLTLYFGNKAYLTPFKQNSDGYNHACVFEKKIIFGNNEFGVVAPRNW